MAVVTRTDLTGVAAWCSTVAQLVNTSSRGTLRLKRGSGGPRFHRGTRPSSLRKAVHRTKATGNLEQPEPAHRQAVSPISGDNRSFTAAHGGPR